MLTDRPFHPPGAEIVEQAFNAFQAWCSERDPDGEMDILDLVEEYGRKES